MGKETALYRHETQASVSDWCSIFPPRDNEPHHRFSRLLEEVVELGVALGVDDTRMQDIVEIAFQKSLQDFARRDQVEGESADVMITLMVLQSRLGINSQQALDDRMARNRARPPAYYAERQRIKAEQGLG